MLLRYTESHFKKEHEATLGVEFASKMVEIDSLAIKTQVWDTVSLGLVRRDKSRLRPSRDHTTRAQLLHF